MKNRTHLLTLTLIFSLLLLFLTGKVAMGNDSAANLRALVQELPETIEEWHKSPEFSIYTGDDLYTYINGGAELYISYHFSALISQPYVNKDNDEIKIDIFDMGSSENAYGIFSHSRETIDDFVGPKIESEYGGGLLTFWKGQYYVSILAYPETESRKLSVQQLARKIAAQIQSASVKPQIVALLPRDDIQPYSIKYFKHFTWINMYHFFANENLLNIDHRTEAVMAKYSVDGPKAAVLLVLQYPDVGAAAAAHRAFRDTFLTDPNQEFSSDADQLWSGCQRDDNLLVIVADAPSLEAAQNLVRGVKQL